ncbi:hypothetical protein [Nitrosomonas aestuarii]|nr:hypothetical protein [Nitrosomonas aestuarii]PTN12129.1 hypothetical protein C8R11_10591 [Nitrosomonas aestuarii]
MSAKNIESDKSNIDRSELISRLCKLAERDREAVAEFAAGCELQVLPLTT